MFKRKGFTLLELMIVVIIIGILATIALPSFSGMIEKARTSEAINILGSVRTAAQIYYLEAGNYPNTLDYSGIQTELGVDVPADGGDWDYDFIGTGDTSLTTNYGQATRSSSAPAPYNGKKLQLKMDGTWGGDHPFKPKS